MRSSTLLSLLVAAGAASACDSCYGPANEVVHERLVRRIQPGTPNATVGPNRPLEWGQLNFMHTTDTHAWLSGHLKEQNYGADWGDFVSFTRTMKHRAGNMGVDLLLVDTGDLHDGNGLGDASSPNGLISDPIFREVDYDVLTIGNHELYVSELAYETFSKFSKAWGDKYVTSNVQIINPATGEFEYIGQKYRYFETKKGLRIMAFGILYDFTGNSNVSKITKGADMVKEQWFLDAINHPEPIDVFLVIGHNPVRPSDNANTLKLAHQTIRALRPDVPVQIFGGHNHVRDFQVYDQETTALGSGRYCETLGWLSMSNIKSSTFRGNVQPRGVANPTRKATNTSTSELVYSRRYLDWNRLTFEYHAVGSQSGKFDLHSGLRVTDDLTEARKALNLAKLYGCAPETYCLSCVPFGAPGNIFNLVPVALGATVINPERSSIPHYVIINTGSVRFDLLKGPFTFDDSFIVSPFLSVFQYIPSVPYAIARNVINSLNNARLEQKRDVSELGSMPLPSVSEECVNPSIDLISSTSELKSRGIVRRQTVVTPGYVTTDAFGTDGDDTPHSKIPFFRQPNYVQGNASFPADGSNPDVVDVVFLDFFAAGAIAALNKLGGNYTLADVTNYVPSSFTTQSYLPEYAKKFWQANAPNCPIL